MADKLHIYIYVTSADISAQVRKIRYEVRVSYLGTDRRVPTLDDLACQAVERVGVKGVVQCSHLV